MSAAPFAVEQDSPSPQSITELPSVPEVSIVVISFNTCTLLHECLESIAAEAAKISHEIIVVDNASTDGSAEMVEQDFPHVHLIRSNLNLGFGNANNVALEHACGRYFVLLNSDAFFAKGSLARAIHHMDENPNCALGGALLVSRDGSHQPSARAFHTLWGDAIVLSGLANKFPHSRLFGRFDRTWADPLLSTRVDWVPGAFSIVRPAALRRIGVFDPAFFLYYEEVDLCLRLKQAGYDIWYWPDIVVTHIGGESSRQLKTLEFSSGAAQVVLWRMRSTLLYYRKHQGLLVHLAYWLEHALYTITVLRNSFSSTSYRKERKRHHKTLLALLKQAWRDTRGGRLSPPKPW